MAGHVRRLGAQAGRVPLARVARLARRRPGPHMQLAWSHDGLFHVMNMADELVGGMNVGDLREREGGRGESHGE